MQIIAQTMSDRLFCPDAQDRTYPMSRLASLDVWLLKYQGLLRPPSDFTNRSTVSSTGANPRNGQDIAAINVW